VIFTPRIVGFVALIVFVGVLLQLSFFSLMPLLGSVINVVPVVVVAIGLLGGAVPGATAGFSAGLLEDSVLGTTLGTSSLALLLVGYLAGRWRETYNIASGWVPPVISGVLTALYALVTAALQLMLGVDGPVSAEFLREVLVQGLLGALIALIVFPLVRRILRPALVDSGEISRRRGARGMLGVRR
jgi:rod shape-determining protein MreD